MKEYDGKKLRSLAVVIFLLLSTFAAISTILVVDKVGADGATNPWECDGYGNVTAFVIASPTPEVGTTYKRGHALSADSLSPISLKFFTKTK